ncbi:MAG TPA: multidrug ABC transporter ATP-binding protein, partial [Firmicutes bacterium]|nr:multidrug ABC transporter ATP-binding protein [Bacillota bacterium]
RGQVPALEDVSFLLHRQEKVALVGLNGSGKSTLIKLLLRLYDPDKGVIRINGADIREYRLFEL